MRVWGYCGSKKRKDVFLNDEKSGLKRKKKTVPENTFFLPLNLDSGTIKGKSHGRSKRVLKSNLGPRKNKLLREGG